MNELLERLGKRVQVLRAAKGWSQEQFAQVCGLHRTYVGQIERAEKNVSFENLTKLSAALGINLAELLSGLEGDAVSPKRVDLKSASNGELRTQEFQRLARRLNVQQAAVQKTIEELLKVLRPESLGPDALRSRTKKGRAMS